MEFCHRLCLLAALATAAACTPVPPAPSLGVRAPDSALFLVRGYRSESDPCRLAGETEFTVNFLDDAADLVACPTGSDAEAELVAATGAPELARTVSFTLYSVTRPQQIPSRDARAPLAPGL